tara:strand:+ start:20951 stop:21085 length:135 start_codon:yes stop_codon:yes gene_type:complete
VTKNEKSSTLELIENKNLLQKIELKFIITKNQLLLPFKLFFLTL